MKKVLSVVLCVLLILSLSISSFAISAVPVKTIIPSASSLTMNIGSSLSTSVTFTPANTTQKLVKYSTSNKNVASVSSKGVVKAAGVGTAVITVISSSNSNVKATINVTVNKYNVPKKQTTLTMTLIGSKQEADTALVMKKVEEYLKDKLNVKVNLQIYAYTDPYTQKVNTMLAAGESFDVCFTSNWAANYYTNAGSGYFTELNGYLKKYPAIIQNVGKEFLSGSAIDGKNYGVPTNKEQVHNWGYLLKKDLVEKYKIDTTKITKMEDLEPWLEKIKANEAGITPLLAVTMDTPFKFLDWDNLSDDDVPGALYSDNKSGKVINQFTAPESIAMYKKLRSYYEKGWIAKDAATMQNTTEMMKTNKFFAVEQSLKPGKDVEMSGGGVDWVQVDITKPVMSNRETSGALLAIPAASKNKEIAFRFIETLYTDAYVKNLFNYGIEGVHYKVNADGRITQTQTGLDRFNGKDTWRYGDSFKDLLRDTEDLQKMKKFLAYNKAGIALKSLGFVFDKVPVETQVSACKNVIQTYYKELFAGAADVDATVKKMSDELNASGVNDILKEMQSQYDTWSAKVGVKY